MNKLKVGDIVRLLGMPDGLSGAVTPFRELVGVMALVTGLSGQCVRISAHRATCRLKGIKESDEYLSGWYYRIKDVEFLGNLDYYELVVEDFCRE